MTARDIRSTSKPPRRPAHLGFAIVLLLLGAAACSAVIPQDLENALDSSVTSIRFTSGSDDLEGSSQGYLREVARMLERDEHIEIAICGYSDNAGPTGANLALSARRANVVMRFLERRGVGADRMEVRTFGESNPIASNETADGRSRNRRIEIVAN